MHLLFEERHPLRAVKIACLYPIEVGTARKVRNGPKKLDSFSSVFKCSVASGYAAIGSGFRL